jgi:hypothetical protein
VDHAGAQTWLDSYVAAWLSYDADEIRALFTEDIAYRYHPSEDPIVGREAVVASWLGESDSDGASTRMHQALTRRVTRRSPLTTMWWSRQAPLVIASGRTGPLFVRMTTAL